ATAAAVKTLRERLARVGKDLHAVHLQREVRRGIEALVGVVSDPTFGPLVVCGLGGVQVELLRDASFRLPPVTDLDATEMIDRLRLKPLLDGYRGAPAGDRAALLSLVQRVSALVEAVPELREMDLNPVKVLPPGQGAVVVDARMRVGRLTAADLRGVRKGASQAPKQSRSRRSRSSMGPVEMAPYPSTRPGKDGASTENL